MLVLQSTLYNHIPALCGLIIKAVYSMGWVPGPSLCSGLWQQNRNVSSSLCSGFPVCDMAALLTSVINTKLSALLEQIRHALVLRDREGTAVNSDCIRYMHIL